MAREYGKLLMSAWTDRDFTSLTRRAQGTYAFLVSQPDLNRAGVMTMALNRWASRCAENDREVILDDLGELARGRFVIVDESEEEVLIRTYIRNDDGWKSPNIMIAIAAAARQVSSETSRAVIRDELGRIDTSRLSTAVSTKTGRSTKEFIESLILDTRDALSDCSHDPDVMAWGTLRGRVTERVPNPVKMEGFGEGFPEGSLTTTTPTTATTTATATTPAEIGALDADDSTPDGFDEFWDVYDHKIGRKNAEMKYAVALRKRGVTPELLIEAARTYIAHQRAEGKHPQYTKAATAWLNGEHWNDERAARTEPQTRTEQHLALVRKLAEQEAEVVHLPEIGTGR